MRRRVILRGHPFLPDGRYAYYRVIVAERVGRKLRTDEHVHHINGDPTDDRPENLQLLKAGDHAKVTNMGKKRSKLTRKRISQAQMGIPKNHGEAVSKALKGKKWPESRKKKHSERLKEYFRLNPRPYDKPWEGMGISRRTWYRRKAIYTTAES